MYSYAFVFSYFSKQQSWGFIALNDSIIAGQIRIVPIEKWNDKYSMCRVLYSQAKACELIDSGQIITGPDLYMVFDISTVHPTPVITIRKPRHIDGIEFIHDNQCNNIYTVTNYFSFTEIKQKCIELLGIALTKCTDLSEESSMKDFAIPI